MGRVVRDWKPIKVDEKPVAPHRYLWNGTIGADGQPLPDITLAENRADARKCVPYGDGDVVYVELSGKAVKALITDVFFERNWAGDYREKFRVQVETKDGTFSKLWEYTYSGFVQRGYKAAGLAPDVVD